MTFLSQETISVSFTHNARSKQESGWVPAPFAVSSCQGRGNSFFCEYTLLLGIPRIQRTGCNEGLLLHPWLRRQRTCDVMQIPDFIPLIGGKGNRFSCNKSLHLHIVGRHQSTGYPLQIDPFISLIDMVRFQLHRGGAVRLRKSRLDLKGIFQLRREFLPALSRATQNTQAGFRAQIVF